MFDLCIFDAAAQNICCIVSRFSGLLILVPNQVVCSRGCVLCVSGFVVPSDVGICVHGAWQIC